MAFTAIPTAGARLRASVLSALLTERTPLFAIKGADTSRASTIARTADPDLSLALPAQSEWVYELLILVSSAANAAGDFSGEIDFPTGGTHSYGVLGLVDTLASGQSADLESEAGTLDGTPPSLDFAVGCSTTITSVRVTGRIFVAGTAGSLTLNWAQLASNVNATIVQDGSHLIAYRVA